MPSPEVWQPPRQSLPHLQPQLQQWPQVQLHQRSRSPVSTTFAKETDSSLKDHVTKRSANANALVTNALVFCNTASRERSSIPTSMFATSHGTFQPVQKKILMKSCPIFHKYMNIMYFCSSCIKSWFDFFMSSFITVWMTCYAGILLKIQKWFSCCGGVFPIVSMYGEPKCQ